MLPYGPETNSLLRSITYLGVTCEKTAEFLMLFVKYTPAWNLHADKLAGRSQPKGVYIRLSFVCTVTITLSENTNTQTSPSYECQLSHDA